MEQLLWNILKASVLGSVLIAILLVFRPLLQKKVQPKTLCAAWAVIAVLLVLPFDFSLPNAPVSVEMPPAYSIRIGGSGTEFVSAETKERIAVGEDREPIPSVSQDSVQNDREAQNETQRSATKRAVSAAAVASGVYALGIVAFLTLQCVRFLQFRLWVFRWKKECTDTVVLQTLEREASTMQIRKPRMFVCESLPTPLLLGIHNAVLLLPEAEYSEEEARYIVRHELTHQKRHDTILQLLLLLINAVHWFNPLVYRMNKAANEDMEQACDSDSTSEMDAAERIAYSETLLRAVSRKMRAIPLTTQFGTTQERMKKRLENVLGKEKHRGRFIVTIVLACALIFGLCVSCTQGEPSPEPSPEPTEAGESGETNVPQESNEIRFAEFLGFFGLSGYITGETDSQGFTIWRYYTNDDRLLAESYGYENDDYGVDFDYDGIRELVCNCTSGGDGHETVLIYRLHNNKIECGTLEPENMQLTDYFNWGVNATACRYDPQNNQFVLTYTSEKDHTKTNEKICRYEDFLFSPWIESDYAEKTSEKLVGSTPAEVKAAIRMMTNHVEYGDTLWYVFEGYFYRYSGAENRNEQLCKIPSTNDGVTPVPCTLTIMDRKIALSYRTGDAVKGYNQMTLFDEDGTIDCTVTGFGSIAIKGAVIVKTNGYLPPEANNLLISRDSGNTWESLGDPRYLYGMRLSENEGSYAFTDASDAFTIEDGYLNTYAIDMSFRSDETKKPEMIPVRINLEAK